MTDKTPNAQNVPITTPEGDAVRKSLLHPAAGTIDMIDVDFGQLEARIVSETTGLCAVFERMGGPSHSQYGQTDSGICYCLACTADQETIDFVSAKINRHVRDCPVCQKRESDRAKS